MRITVPRHPDAVVHWFAPTTASSAPTLLWHHGSPQTGAIPAPVAEAAERLGASVISVARPGYGGAPRRRGRTVADAARQVGAVLDELETGPVVAVGASGGGPHALACAALFPQQIAGVATFASLAPFTDEDGWYDGMADARPLRAAREGERARTDYVEHDEFDPTSFNDADYAALAHAWRSLADDVAEAERFGAEGLIDDDLAFTRPWGVDLSEIAAPVMLVHGSDDRVVPLHHGRALAESIPSATLETVAGAGHISVLERLGRVLDRIAG
jgi:pimeloyl-ACP methyl ester carboxylesterase